MEAAKKFDNLIITLSNCLERKKKTTNRIYMYKDGIEVTSFKNQRYAAEHLGVTQQAISQSLKLNGYTKVKGYTFEFKK